MTRGRGNTSSPRFSYSYLSGDTGRVHITNILMLNIMQLRCMRIAMLSVSVVIGAVASPGARPDTSYAVAEDENLVESARDAYLAGDYNASMQLSFRFLERVRDDSSAVRGSDIAECCLYLGNVNMAHRNYGGAIHFYEDGLAKCDTSSVGREIKRRMAHNLVLASCLVPDRERAVKYMEMLASMTDTLRGCFITTVKAIHQKSLC